MCCSRQCDNPNRDMAMRRLIYDLYYQDKISQEIAHRLLDQLEKSKLKARRY